MMGMPRDENEPLLLNSPVVECNVLPHTEPPILGRRIEIDPGPTLQRSPEVSHDEFHEAPQAIALESALVAVNKQEASDFLVILAGNEEQALMDLELWKHRPQVLGNHGLVSPVIVVVPPYAPVPLPMFVKGLLQVQRRPVFLQNGAWIVFP